MKRLIILCFIVISVICVLEAHHETYYTVTTNGYTWTYTVKNGSATIAKSVIHAQSNICSHRYVCAINPNPSGD